MTKLQPACILIFLSLTACAADEPYVDELAEDDPADHGDGKSDAAGEHGYYAITRVTPGCVGRQCRDLSVFQPNRTLMTCPRLGEARECVMPVDWSRSGFDDTELEMIVERAGLGVDRAARHVIVRGDVMSGALVVREVWWSHTGYLGDVVVKVKKTPNGTYFDSCDITNDDSIWCSMTQWKLNSTRSTPLVELRPTTTYDHSALRDIIANLAPDGVIISGGASDASSRFVTSAYSRLRPGVL